MPGERRQARKRHLSYSSHDHGTTLIATMQHDPPRRKQTDRLGDGV